MSDRSSSSSSAGVGFFGAWQVLYFVLHDAIDAPWNKVQDWPFWSFLNAHSVMFPTQLALIFLIVALLFLGLVALVVD